ncbi:MAG: sugar ABC transporter permease [Oscillospiraceae bacterium]|nr:sugar ABC transporter permease [Oscillospiraceae bacterium]
MKKSRDKLSPRARKDNMVGWLFVAPLVLGFLAILLPILINSVRFSFNEMAMAENGYTLSPVELENYRVVLTVNPDFVRNILASLGSLALLLPSVVIFSLFMAILLNRDLPARILFRTILFIPVILSVGYYDTVMQNDVMTQSLSSLSAFDNGVSAQTGFFTVERINQYLISLNINTSVSGFLVSLLDSIPTIINQSGVQIIIFLAGLQSISPSVYEAAQIEGAAGWVSFWKITVPMISPMILVNLLYTIINYFTGASNTIMQSIQKTMFQSFQFGQGSAMAWIYFTAIVLILAAVYLVAGRLVFYQERG